jgi:hypothetical protein
LLAADAEKAVPRTIAAESAIFVLLNISYLPAKPLRLVVTLGFRIIRCQLSAPSGMTAAATHRRRLPNAWVIPGGQRPTLSFQITLS